MNGEDPAWRIQENDGSRMHGESSSTIEIVYRYLLKKIGLWNVFGHHWPHQLLQDGNLISHLSKLDEIEVIVHCIQSQEMNNQYIVIVFFSGPTCQSSFLFIQKRRQQRTKSLNLAHYMMCSRKCLINFMGKDGPHMPNLMTVRSLQQTIKGYGYGGFRNIQIPQKGLANQGSFKATSNMEWENIFKKRNSKNAITLLNGSKKDHGGFLSFFLITLFSTF